MKEVIIVAGANGSGKTTFAKDFVKKKNYYFVNADEIGVDLEQQKGFQLRAGRIFFEKIQQLISTDQSFVIESTLSGVYLLRLINQLKKHQYSIQIVYVFLENPEACIERVKIRVLKGGHHVPEEDIRRRYYRSKSNFWYQYRQLAASWLIIYNSDEGLQEVALGEANRFMIANEKLFEKFIHNITHASREI